MARASHAVSSDSQRKNQSLEVECAKLKNDLLSKEREIESLRNRNDQLIEIYNLTKEASRLPDDNNTILELLNASMDNFPKRGLEGVSRRELRQKYEAHICDHRTILVCCRNLQRRTHEYKEIIKTLEAQKNTLLAEKERVTVNGAKALKKLHDAKVEVHIEMDRAISEKNVPLAHENEILSPLLIESDDEFAWDARVLDNARLELATNVSLKSDHDSLVETILASKEAAEKEFLGKERKYQQDIESLQAKSNAEIQKMEAKFEIRDAKCRRLKRNLKATVSNLTKRFIRVRDSTIKEEVGELCSLHQIPFPPHYVFEDPSDDEVLSEISDSEGEYEGSDEEDESEDDAEVGEDDGKK